MADIKLLLVEDDKNLAFMEKNTLEDIVGGYEIHILVKSCIHIILRLS